MKRALIIFAVCFLPGVTHAEVLLSEIAWMGTDEKATGEWIELYNFSETPTDITGWIITLNDSPFITLTGSLSPHGVAVLERSSDATLPGTAFQIYTGALPNTGPTLLQLKDTTGAVVDTANGGTDWTGIGGSNIVPKMTPQRTRSGSWVTGAPTPGGENVQQNAVIPEGEADTQSDSDTTEVTTQTTSTSNTSRGGGGSKKVTPQELPIPGVLSLSLTTPTLVYVNQPVTFEVVPSGLGPTMLASLVHTWNFGDTSTSSGKKVTHTFSYPGEYVVVVASRFGKHDAMVKRSITVVPSSFTLEKTDGGDIVVRNTSKYEVDIGGYALNGQEKFIFPKYTFVKAGGSLTIPKERFGGGSRVVMRDTMQVAVAEYAQKVVLSSSALPVVASVSTQRIYTPVARHKEDVSDTKEDIVMVPPTPQVVQIGTAQSPSENPGIFTRLWSRISGIFAD